ncbi:MAG TPA: hypothetical protein VK486_09340 [Thermoleophilaceae bacterium]|nr:hypothetical protein [Thermoleophilaceae bacterium]
MSVGGGLLKADALFEIALGVPLATGRQTGLLDRVEFPPPASDGLAAAFGAGLIPFAGVLWAAAREPTRARLVAIGVVNLGTAGLLGTWLARSRDGAEPVASRAVGATVAALAALGAAELAAASR